MTTLDELLVANCKPLEGSQAFDPDQVQAHLQLVPQWHLAGGKIQREYRFGNYYETLAFVNALAFVVHAQDHHPDLLVRYNTARVSFDTHSVGGISLNDFICAAQSDAIYARRAAT